MSALRVESDQLFAENVSGWRGRVGTLPGILQHDQRKPNTLMEKAVADMGAAAHATLVVLGDKLGLYEARAGVCLLTTAEIASRTSTVDRYVPERLNANTAGFTLSRYAAQTVINLPLESRG